MKRIGITLMVLLFSKVLIAQLHAKHFFYDNEDLIGNRFRNQLKFTPFKILGMVNPGVELSYERLFKNRFSGQITAAYLLPRPAKFWSSNASLDPEKTGFKIAFEQKYYLRRVSPNGIYLAVEVDYMRSYNKAVMNFSDANGASSLDTFGIDKNNICLNFKFGYHFAVKRIIVDIFAGLGIQYRNAVHSNRLSPADDFRKSPHLYLPAIYNREGVSWNINIPLSFRIGYLF